MAASLLSFVRTKRGGRKAILDGYMYTLQRQAEGVRYSQWACARREVCKGRLKMSPDEKDWEVVGIHNHLPNFGETKAEKVKAVGKAPSLITQEALGTADSETRVALPRGNTEAEYTTCKKPPMTLDSDGCVRNFRCPNLWMTLTRTSGRGVI